MARLIILGSAAAIADETHDNTHFLLRGDNGCTVLVDCASNPVPKFRRLGILPDHLTDLILTHFHPDHVCGVPALLMQLWLLGRKAPLPIYGLHHCLQRVERTMQDYMWDTWPGLFSVDFRRVAERDRTPVLDNDDFRITSWPTRHFIPTIGLRIEVKTSGKVVGYSCDGEPIPAVIDLARGADLLIHEATGERYGHSSAAQAGQTATKAGAKRLALIHYEVWNKDPRPLVEQAQTTFSGPVELAEDFSEYEI
ncbi:MAG: MBL fold metallo-hydrolase [Anaerolineae bacterium]|jgi:ribonuclease Z|nr:MBL fold metallo-hydrolase [Anaerolineae bacterium]